METSDHLSITFMDYLFSALIHGIVINIDLLIHALYLVLAFAERVYYDNHL
ncbi:hypothetical protein SAMN04244571_04569 [Azotobacter beijerinckii]|uniref:Uncharacterized protein n=1 Tax=Azotobacter beijerinckii TaxID=170623 RepID=A0A1I1CME2_9GAMM|nr:hypothetical protein SAMN04244571_04569 [Azotobacter beijerinckii]